MSINLKIAVSLVMLFFVIISIKNIKNKKLQLSFSTFWIVIGVIFVIVMAIPNCLESLTTLLGFEVVSNMVFFIAIFIIFYLILILMVGLSKEVERNVNLIQEVGILKEKIEKLEREIHS